MHLYGHDWIKLASSYSRFLSTLCVRVDKNLRLLKFSNKLKQKKNLNRILIFVSQTFKIDLN